MNAKLALTLAALGGITAAHGALLAYEPFDYNAGDDVDDLLNGGLGFAAAWTAGQQGGKITVYDETAATVTNNTAGEELTWDGVVNNVPTGPPGGSEFTGTVFTVDTRPFWRDSTVSPSNFGYHWNHNGETHFLIGDAMGEGMETMLTP